MMRVLDFFKKIPNLSINEAQKLMTERKPDTFYLIDIREPIEYKKEHLPGARLIPLSSLPGRVFDLKKENLIIVYCDNGIRSRTAVSILKDTNFKEVYYIKGGMKFWKGLTVIGPPDAGMAYFSHVESPLEMIKLAWALEEGSRQFYQAIAKKENCLEIKVIYEQLMKEEENHKQMLVQLFSQISREHPPVELKAGDFSSVFSNKDMEVLMEGQMKLREVIEWSRHASVYEIIDFSLSQEAKLYDLYMRMLAKHSTGNTYFLLSFLASAEKMHLDLFSKIMEKSILTNDNLH
jgi:rhodanese-related sulfurtransferase/rubrerythrin